MRKYATMFAQVNEEKFIYLQSYFPHQLNHLKYEENCGKQFTTGMSKFYVLVLIRIISGFDNFLWLKK